METNCVVCDRTSPDVKMHLAYSKGEEVHVCTECFIEAINAPEKPLNSELPLELFINRLDILDLEE